MSQKIYVSNKCCHFELSIHYKMLKIGMVSIKKKIIVTTVFLDMPPIVMILTIGGSSGIWTQDLLHLHKLEAAVPLYIRWP